MKRSFIKNSFDKKATINQRYFSLLLPNQNNIKIQFYRLFSLSVYVYALNN